MRSKKTILDCETYDSALNSISQIFGMSKADITQELEIIPLINDKDLLCEFAILNYDRDLINYFINKFNISTEYHQSCWFHFSRTNDVKNFDRGILPFHLLKEEIFSFISKLASDISINHIYDVRNRNDFAHLLNMKCIMFQMNGPFGFLIKETGLNSVNGNHDYKEIPEVVEDIIHSLYPEKSEPLTKRYKQHTTPCVVKFISDINEPKYLGQVLLYLYLKIRHMRLTQDCICCFDNHGKTIHPALILGVELL